MHFDVIPKAVDEYHQQLRAYPDQDDKGKMNNPVFHIHGDNVPDSDMVVPFAMLLNLASVSGAEDKETLWGFIQRYAPDASLENNPQMDQAAGFAVRYYNDFVKPQKVYRTPTDQERAAMIDMVGRLKIWEGGLDAEELQSMVFAVGKEHEFDPLRNWFTALYEVLLGASQGPRFGGFIALYGIDETVALIEDALSKA
jgi:lysyl-tRNA synthetase class 1